MSAFNRVRLLAVVIGLVSAGCDDNSTIQAPTAPMRVGPDEVYAFIAASNTNPGVGSEVTIYVRARRGSAVAAIGSFTMRLSYDSTRLRFVRAARSANGMVLANPDRRGVVIAAGAAAEGFTDDNLFAGTFTVTAANALKSLELSVTELNSVQFKDERANTSVARGLYRATAER